MYTEYIIKKKNNSAENFFISNGVIYVRCMKNGVWQERVPVVENVNGTFSVNVLNGNTTIIFCRKATGEIITAVNEGDGWNYRHILKQYRGKGIKAYLCGNANGTRIIYNAAAENRNVLISQILSENGKWGMGERIDEVTSDGVFDVRFENCGIIVFYQKTDGVFGYRIVRNGYIGEFTELSRINPFVSDISFIYDNGTVHILYVGKSMLTGHLYYKRKNADGTEKLTVLYEGAVRKCCVYKVDGVLYFLWSSGEKLYVRESCDGGESFSKPERIKEEFERKAGITIYDDNASIYEAFINDRGIVHLGSVYMEITRDEKRRERNVQSVSENVNDVSKMKMKNKIDMLAKSNFEKDRQIAELSQKVSSRNRENIENEVRLIKEIQRLKDENEELRKRLNEEKAMKTEAQATEGCHTEEI